MLLDELCSEEGKDDKATDLSVETKYPLKYK
jgi:hypothetical protein